MIYPTNCPSCDSTLVREGPNLYCRNVECCAQTSKKVIEFAKKIKLKGLGPATLQKLEQINSISDIYKVPEKYLVEKLGEKLGTKLYQEIQKSINHPLEVILPALGIPNVGTKAANVLAEHVTSLFDVTPSTASKLGPKTGANLMDWLEDPNNWEELPFILEFSSKPKFRKVCISGKLTTFNTKAEAEPFLLERGYSLVSSVTQADILVNESGKETSKTQQALSKGIPIITNILEIQ